jgi:thiamine biosynthesis lipoprotein
MISIGEKWRIETEGVFDIAIKKKLENIGYGHTEGVGDSSDEVDVLVSRVVKHEDTIIWDSKKQIDLGGIGKGFLIDKLARILEAEYNIHYFLINGGGDIYATSNQGEPIELLLEHPTEAGMYIGKISIQDSSLCVSSSFKRTWVKEGHRYNHFIDTKRNAVIESASYVYAETATIADILATILAILSHSKNEVKVLAEKYTAEYLTLNSKGEVYCSPVFKNALEAV